MNPRGRLWLWLEDKPQTVTDFAPLFREVIEYRQFNRCEPLMDFLLDLQKRGDAYLEKIGFILDISIVSQQVVAVPSQWSGARRSVEYSTEAGYDAGLVFYEKCVLPNRVFKRRVFKRVPPTLFLTVSHQDRAEVAGRWRRLQERWAAANGVKVGDAKVRWFRKWHAKEEILDCLTAWNRVES